MDTLFTIILVICAIAGWIAGQRDLKNVKEGKAPGVVRDDEGHTTYIFYDDVGLGD